MPHLVKNDILIPEIVRIINAGQQVLFTPKGESMRPFIEGDRDSVVLGLAGNLRIGDILLCQLPNHQSAINNQQSSVTRNPSPVTPIYVLHRLIAIDGDRLTLMGDGNLVGCEYCTRADVLGRVLEIRSPRGRRKPLTRGRLWYRLRRFRPFMLKLYRKLYRKLNHQ